MNFERDSAIPLTGNRDSWSHTAVNPGASIPVENRTRDSVNMMTPRRPIPVYKQTIPVGNGAVTPERTILQRKGIVHNKGWNSVVVEKQENQTGNENWEDLIGMYTDLLQEETLDLNGIVEDLNLTPPPMVHNNQNQTTRLLHLNQASSTVSCFSAVEDLLVNEAQNSTLRVPTRTNVSNSSTQTFVSNNTKDGFPVPYRPYYNLNSPPRSEPEIGSLPFVPITPDNQKKHMNSRLVPENVNFPVLDTSIPSKNGNENQTVSLEDAENLYNKLLQTIGDSPSSAISTTRNEHVCDDIDLNKTPEQKTPARRKRHRPKVIREGKPKNTPKPKNTENETRVKRKYVRKTGVNSNTPKTQNGKRKYVRKKGVGSSESQVKSGVDDVVETREKTCKKRLNFDLECVARDEDIERERSVNNLLETSAMKVTQLNEYTAGTMQARNQHVSGHALNLLARNLTMRNNVQGQDLQGLDERRGIKRQSYEPIYRQNVNAMESIRLYQKMLLGVESRSNNINNFNNVFLENQKKMKMQSEFQGRVSCEPYNYSRQMNGVYRNGLAMQVLNSCRFRAPVGAPHVHQLSSGMKPCATGCGQGHEIGSVMGMIGWNPVPATPLKDVYRSAVGTYPVALLENKQSGKAGLYNKRLNGVDQMLQQHCTNPISSMIPKGRPRKQKAEVSVDDITHKLVGLSICDKNNKGQNALVLYKDSKAMIPFEPIKKRIPRPKVDLDPETDRLWRLLMGKEGGEGAETLDKDKEKWWEDERRVFRGRADSFIARMHLVQGDRRFSRWKGSVVDSVIGVFLTQNVSDHLSSSAFMSLAAKFPLKSTTYETPSQDHPRVIIEEPIEVVKPIDIMKRQPVGAANRHNRVSEEEVISSQDSFDSSTIQTVDEIRSSSGSNSEAEDLTNGFETSKQSGAPVNVIQAEKASVLKESFGHDYWSRLLHEQATNIQHLPKDQGFSIQIPRMNRVENLNSSSRFTPPNLLQESLVSSGARTSSLPSSNYGMTENGTQKQDSAVLGGITISFEANSKEHKYDSHEPSNRAGTKILRERKAAAENDKNRTIDWDSMRKQVFLNGEKRERNKDATDSLDYEALRGAHVNEISDAIKERGMNNLLADRIKDFLNRLVRDHGSIDLEWLRDAPPDKAKDYLLSFRGLGLKSVECVRLLTLHHLAFPVDTNVGRIAVRLGWVPLQPLPESLQLHLLEMYPVLESIQKYLWPRLCKLDQLTLYELHYQMITFGKVFCTKSKPNCNACPMRAECRHFASAFASARLSLPGPEEKRIVTSDAPVATDPTPPVVIKPMLLPQAENNYNTSAGTFGQSCEPIIEEPTTPEPETEELSISDIEDQYYEDSDEIPSIKLNMEEFTTNLQNIMEDGKELQDDMSKALVALNPNAASIPTPKLKNYSRLRTEHQVYELPDSHQLLEGLDKREPDDPSPYLLAIWTPGETANSIQPPERGCPAQEAGRLCDQTTCFSCNSIKEANSQVVRGTILIPCRTAMRGSFPLNGTYFQVNEMFADHASSLNPIDVPRAWIWNLPRRTVYFGTSVSTIFKGLSTEGIQYCFWRGFVCVRGFDQKTRAPRPLMARLHFPASKLKTKNEDK